MKLRNRILGKFMASINKSLAFLHRLIGIPHRIVDSIKAKAHLNSRKAKNILVEAKSVEEFWELSHKKQSRRWITGSSPTDELGYLQFNEGNSTVQKILVVGVGTGATTNYLAGLGHEVSVLDISPASFSSLNPKIEKRFLTNEYNKIPQNYYSFVLHHLVAQHMSDTDLQIQIEVLYKALAPGGSIKLQFASSLVPSKNDQTTISETDIKLGQVLRSKEKVGNLISKELSGNWTILGRVDFPNWEEGWSWHLLEIVK